MSYPRTCRARNGNPRHLIRGPEDEQSNGTDGRRKCKHCAAEREATPRYRDREATYRLSTKGMVGIVRREVRDAHQRLETL